MLQLSAACLPGVGQDDGGTRADGRLYAYVQLQGMPGGGQALGVEPLAWVGLIDLWAVQGAAAPQAAQAEGGLDDGFACRGVPATLGLYAQLGQPPSVGLRGQGDGGQAALGFSHGGPPQVQPGAARPRGDAPVAQGQGLGGAHVQPGLGKRGPRPAVKGGVGCGGVAFDAGAVPGVGQACAPGHVGARLPQAQAQVGGAVTQLVRLGAAVGLRGAAVLQAVLHADKGRPMPAAPPGAADAQL